MLRFLALGIPVLLFVNTKLAAQTPAADSNPQNMLHQYTSYNEWANTQMTNWLTEATDAQFEQELESSFPSLKTTLLHIWNAEYLWLQILKEEPSDEPPGKQFEGTMAELLEAVLQTSANFRSYVHGLNPEALQGKVPSGNSSLYIADIIQHCMNHSTYHRGQLITMGRQVGLQSPPRTDFIHYIRIH